MGNPEIRPDTIFEFIGTIAQNQPEVLDSLTPRDRYILFAHSDIKDTRTLAEMTTIFNASTNTIGRTYKKALTTVYESANAQTQEVYPFEEIAESLKIRHKNRAIEGTREIFSDPVRRRTILAKMSEGHKRSYQNNPELRQISSMNFKGRHHTEEAKAKISAKLKGRKRPPSVFANTVGIPRTPEVKEKISVSNLIRLEDPEERQKQATYGFAGKKHSKENKRKMSKSAIKSKVKQAQGWEDSEDLTLWKYAKTHNLIQKIIEAGYLTQDDISALNRHFRLGEKTKNLNRLLNQLSLGVANLS